MFKIFRKELDWGGTPLVLESGKVARQADGAVMVTLGETTVLCTAVAAQQAKPGQDFFPLTVNYQEKAFAAGKIPGGFFKREGRPSENETLVCRLIDRPIRPLFPKSFKCETQVICTVLAHDMENNPDIAAMIGASAALTLSHHPGDRNRASRQHRADDDISPKPSDVPAEVIIAHLDSATDDARLVAQLLDARQGQWSPLGSN